MGKRARPAGRRLAKAFWAWTDARLRSWDGWAGLTVTAAGGVALSIIYFFAPRGQTPEADGHYIWLFARSLAFDGDLDFANDYQLCGDPWGIKQTRAITANANPYYVGPSLFWVPLLWLARRWMTLPGNATAAEIAGCSGPIATFALFAGPIVGTLTLYLCYRAARRFVNDGVAAMATAVIGLGGSLVAYSTEFASYTHAYVALCVAAVVLLTLRAWERPQSISRWALVGLALTITALQRSTEAMVALVPATVAMARLWRQWPRLALVLVILGLAALVGAAPAHLLYKEMYGAYFQPPQGPHYMQLSRAHPFLLLFAPHGGLLYTTPAAWLSVAGIVVCLRRWAQFRLFAGALILFMALTIYLYASPLDWHGAGTFGARRLTGVTVVLVLFAACALERIARALRARPERALVVAGTLATFFVASSTAFAVLAQGLRQLPAIRAPTQSEFFGHGNHAAWSLIDEHVGPLAVLPAALLFRLRYGVPMSAFALATETYWYERNPYTFGWVNHWVPVGKTVAPLTTNMEATSDGLAIKQARATFVFSAQWPFATHVTFSTRAVRKTKLRVGAGHLSGTTWYGEVEVDVGAKAHELIIPPGSFSSGIREVVFEVPDVGAQVVLTALSFTDRNKYE